METIEYLMTDSGREQGSALFPALRGQPETVRFLWHDAQVRLHCIPRAWAEAGEAEIRRAKTEKAKTGKAEQGKAEAEKARTEKTKAGKARTEKAGRGKAEAWKRRSDAGPGGGKAAEGLRRRLLAGKLDRYLHSGLLPQEGLWVAPELEPFFPKYEQPLPGPELAARILRDQPFRQILAVFLDPGKRAEEDRLWLERFLELGYADLNGLYLVTGRETDDGQTPNGGSETAAEGMRSPGIGTPAGNSRVIGNAAISVTAAGRTRKYETMRPDGAFWEWLYEQSGLSACFTERLPETDGRKTAVVDLRRNARPPVRELAFGSLYLDLTSQPYRLRLMGERRPDISCISARNYLDTAFKERYNAI